MPLAKEVAAELRRIADALDKEPETPVQKAHLFFSCMGEKDQFVAMARLLPRPIIKKYDNPEKQYGEVKLTIEGDALYVQASVYRSVVCKLIKPAIPAEYDCEPLLSAEEEESLTEA